MNYYPAYICENGHAIETSSPFCDKKYCTDCGAKVIFHCPECHAAIQGHPYGASGCYRVPAYCGNCGKPYPWTIASIEATTHLVKESELDSVAQQKLIEILPDVISQTPRSQLAALRIQKAISSAGKFVAEGLKQFVIDFGCEFLKKQFDL